MFGLSEQTRVFLKTGATDGRLGLDALRGLVSQVLRQDALTGSIFAFSKGSSAPSSVSIAQSTDGLVMVLLGGVETLTGRLEIVAMRREEERRNNDSHRG